MRKFLSLSFLAISSLIAGNTPFTNFSALRAADALPNTSTRTVVNSNNIKTFADLIYWNAEEGATGWADSTYTFPSSFSQKSVSFDWKFGFKAGLGYEMDYDQWDTQLYYTWFRTEGTDQASIIPGKTGGITSAYLGNFIDIRTFQSAAMQWDIFFSIFDLELGRKYLVSNSLAVRPFIGLKGGWIDQSIKTLWNNPTLSASENLKNNFWGVGPSGGLNTEWRLSKNRKQFFSLFGDFSSAFMWGDWICSDVYNNSAGQEVFVNTPNSNLGALMVRSYSGIGWSFLFNREQTQFSFRIGYEMQLWFNQLRIPTFDQLRVHHDLTLQGGTFECRLDF